MLRVPQGLADLQRNHHAGMSAFSRQLGPWFIIRVSKSNGAAGEDGEAAPPRRDPELVFALASPIGTPMDDFRDTLSGGLISYGYSVDWIKLSRLLSDQAQVRGTVIRQVPESDRVSDLMDVGDRLCEESGSSAAVALQGVVEIRQKRNEFHSNSSPVEPCSSCGHSDDVISDDKAIPRRAWVLDSLKRPAEVKQLRQIYGDHLVVIGIQAQPTTRRTLLNQQVRPHVLSKDEGEVDAIVDRLVARDLDERGKDPHGQNILKTFPMADVFVSVDDARSDVSAQVSRLLDLLFGNPNYPVPTSEEFGMYLAAASAANSPELGLKVGAAVMRGTTVVSLGTNAHPTTKTSSPAYDRSALDIRQLVLDTMLGLAAELSQEARDRLVADPDSYVGALLSGPLKSGRINHLTEFQQPVHAEMSAILEAVEQGRSVKGSTVYVTAYPCHGCAKHLLRLGLPVRYIEPYPKSRAEAMYGQEVVGGAFQPFTGIAPRRYHQLFTTGEDRKDPAGVRKPWTASQKAAADPNVDPLIDQASIALREAVAIVRIPVRVEG